MLDILYGNRVNTGERLVEHYELRVYGQATRNLCTAALATRELVTLVLADLVQTELGKQALKPLLALLLVEVGHFKYRHDIVLYCHLAEHARLLRQIANTGTGTLVHGVIGYFLVVDEHMSLIRNDKSRRHVERCCLTRSVRTKKTYYLSLADVEGHLIGNSTLAVAFY